MTPLDEARRKLGSERNGEYLPHGHPAAEPTPIELPQPVPWGQLQGCQGGNNWLWKGYVARQEITLLSALWKAGKTTLLSHLMVAFEKGGQFCGQAVEPSRVLYVTEESQARWASRRLDLGLGDDASHVHFICRPFSVRPMFGEWIELIKHVQNCVKQSKFDLVVFDTLSALWPVEKENDASMVQNSLMPLRMISDHSGLLIVHHLRKGDGTESTASRGSGALPAFVDTILELRRYAPGENADTRRVLSGSGRWDETPAEVVIQRTENGYTAQGDRQEVRKRGLEEIIRAMLPTCAPGWTWQSVKEAWPNDETDCPNSNRLLELLNRGFEKSLWNREGSGRKGSPFRYFRGPSVVIPFDENHPDFIPQ